VEQSYFNQRAWEGVSRIVSAARPCLQQLLDDFAHWLRFVRELQPGSIRLRVMSARDFLEKVVDDDAADPVAVVARLSAKDLETFFVRHCESRGYAARRYMRSALKRLLLFLSERGHVDPLLVDVIPSVQTYKLATVPRGIEDQKIRQLLDAIPADSPVGIRDRAIILLLAVYGVRRAQVSQLRFKDIRWGDRTIHFPAHKGGKPVVHTLISPVASALARYIREVRPSSDFDQIFLRFKQRPYFPLSYGGISQIVRDNLKNAKISAHHFGAHIFRHAFATRLLRAGHPLKTIADLLGHRHLDSAAIYAKVDVRSLGEAAADWPEVLR